VDLLLTKDAEGRNPFHYACRYAGNVGTLRFLLAQEEKLNSQKYTTHDTHDTPHTTRHDTTLMTDRTRTHGLI
jgi:hypothetical protein